MLLRLFFPLIFFAAIILFYPSFNYYFFQDDWFVLNWVQNDNFASLLQFRTDIIYWRPISMPIFFKVANELFGLNPLGFHLALFLIHLANTFLIFSLFRVLTFSRTIALFIAFLYATASVHFIPLSWLSTASYVIGPFFILMSLIFYLKQKYFFSLVTFLFALASSEFSLVFIPIAAILSYKQSSIKLLSPHVFAGVIYLIFRFLAYPIPSSGEYEIAVSPKTLSNLFWYFAWTFNVPEKISTIFYFSNIKGSTWAILPFANQLLSPLTFIASFLFLMVKTKPDAKKILSGVLIFIAGIGPVILLPNHVYPMYVMVASLGAFYLLAQSLSRLAKFQTLTILYLGALWLMGSTLTLEFTRSTHWIANLQAISLSYIKEVQRLAPNPAEDTVFVFKPADVEFSQQNKFTLVETEDNIGQSLNGQDALRVIYKDTSIKSVFTTHQKPVNFPGANVVEISPSAN